MTELHQFRLLSRTSVRRLLDSALFSHGGDAVLFALWGLALAATPPVFFSGRQIFLYASLKRIPPDVVERIVLGHRKFFVTYAMIAVALVAALMWDSLFPDRDDQEVVGVLPVRTRTLAAARLGAALWLGLLFSVGISVPSAVAYTGVSLLHVGASAAPFVLLGHAVSMMLACQFVYLSLLTLRAIVAFATGDRASRWVAGGLQLVTVILLVETIFFLPGIAPSIVRAMLNGNAMAVWLPPAWFTGLNSWIAESGSARFGVGAGLALAGSCLPAVIVGPTYLLPARWAARRVLETKGSERLGLLPVVLRWMATIAVRTVETRAIAIFAATSLSRSRRHSLIVATFVGLGVAMCIGSLYSANHRQALATSQPEPYWLALPLAMTFFVVFGLRTALTIPTDLDASWPFRLSLPHTRTVASATGFVLFTLGVLPFTILTMVMTLPMWPLTTVAVVSVMHLLTGAFLVECVLLGWAQIPFARAHVPGSKTLRWKWFPFAVALNVYAFQLSDLQVAALNAATGVVWYVGACTTALIAVHLRRRWLDARLPLSFDADEDVAVEALNLSEALR